MSNTTGNYTKHVVYQHDSRGRFLGLNGFEVRCDGKTLAHFPDNDTSEHYANLFITACKADDESSIEGLFEDPDDPHAECNNPERLKLF